MQRPRGTRDFAPAEQARRIQLLDTFRSVATQYHFQEVQTPTFEELSLFTSKSGDGIISELYNFKDKGDRDMCLRPEVTAPVMRMYFAEHAFDPKPVKWTYYANCFRYDRPQAGRYREFWQYGCEIIGTGTPLAYAELIAFAHALLRSAGVEFVFRVGHVALLRERVAKLGLDDAKRAALMRAIDKKDMDAVASFDPDGQLSSLFSASDLSGFAGEAADELNEVLGLLSGLPVQLDLTIARGLDYYTGIVFEAHCDALGSQSQILGGGGYDLSGVFGAQATETMGFGLGFDRVLVAQGDVEGATASPAVYLGGLSAAANAHLMGVVQELREYVSVQLHLGAMKPNAIAKGANQCGARDLVMVGDRDLEAGVVGIKNMVTGESTTCPLDELVAYYSS